MAFVVFVALEEEFRYVVRRLGLDLAPVTEAGITYYLVDLPLNAGESARGAVAFRGDMGTENAAVFTRTLIDLLHPRLVVNLGISGSLKNWVRLGDVVVATATDDYLHRGKAVAADGEKGWSVQPGGEQFPTSPEWTNLARNAEFAHPRLWQAWAEGTEGSRPAELESVLAAMRSSGLVGERVSVHVEHVASGPLVGAAREFKTWLARHDRNYHALDMESAGVARTAHNHPDKPSVLIVRGISDPSDERKEQLDERTGDAVRRWAVDNALRFFLLLMKASDAPWLRTRLPLNGGGDLRAHADALHAAIRERYLSAAYQNEAFLKRAPFGAYARLFERITELREVTPAGNLFETVVQGAESLQGPGGNASALQVEGPAGSGKTSFLNVLYWWLLREHAADPGAGLPVYINLHTYNPLSADGDRADTAVTARLQTDLAPLRAIIGTAPQQPLVLIVDGDDAYARHQSTITTYLRDLLNPCTYKRIIGLRSMAEVRPRKEPVRRSVYLRSLAPGDPELPDFIADFCEVVEGAASENVKAQVETAVRESHLPEIDFFTLTLLSSSEPRQAGRNLAMLLRDYVREYVERRPAEKYEAVLARAAEAAFLQDIRPRDAPAVALGTLENELLNLHPRVRDYLVAQHVINTMLKMSTEEAVDPRAVLDHVYPYRINRLCKELISGNEKTQARILSAIRKILENPETPGLARAHACYLAGRVDTLWARDEALKILTRQRKALSAAPPRRREKLAEPAGSGPRRGQRSRRRAGKERERQKRVDLLVVRTLYISLAYLGDHVAGIRYVGKLLADPRQDRLNRGFHLEYYGDQMGSRDLVSVDEMGPCPRTFEQLRNRLLSKHRNPIFQIELQTLASLAQHRHARGTLQPEDAERVSHVISNALRQKKRVQIPDLRRYLKMVREHLSSPDFRVAQVYDTFHRIKEVRRSGWAARGITDGESVADHAYSAYLLGLIFLPMHWKNRSKYSRTAVLDHLLLHDLAEAVTGDVLPWNRNPLSAQREHDVYSSLSMVGTYTRLANLEHVRRYMDDFNKESNFNAEVANDLDRLENLVQLWVYRIQGREIPGYDEWEAELREAVGTDLGLQILERLEEYYLPRLEDPGKGIAVAPTPPGPDPRFFPAGGDARFFPAGGDTP